MKGYKTIFFNILTVLLPLLQASGLSDYLTDQWMIWYILGIVAGNLILRVWFTTTPVGSAK